MNKYLIYGGLILTTVFTSCKEELMYEESNNANLQKYVTEGIVSNDEATRANVESNGITFYWQDNDKITIWDGTAGYEFTSTHIEGTTGNGRWISQFEGNASLADGADVYGIYPSILENPLTFTLNDDKRNQTDGNPALSNTMYMVAQGKVTANTVSSLRFKHYTSIFQFNIKNNRPDPVTIESVKVSASAAVFPTVVTVSGGEVTYSEMVSSLSLKMNNQSVNNAETLRGYLNFLPTPELPSETELVFSVHLSDGSDVVFVQGKAGELYEAGSGFAKDGYKYTAGKRYSVNCLIDLDASDPGYKLEDGEYIVYAAKGLKAIFADDAIIGATETRIKLSHDINLEGAAIAQIAAFNGIFNGNGKFISNYTLTTTEGSHFGLFKQNSGTIQNLTIKDVTLNASVNTANDGASALIGINSANAKVKDCSANNINLTLTSGKAAFGILVGNNAGTIEGVNISNSSLITNAECNLGLASGINSGKIYGSDTQGTITVNNHGGNASSVGGLIGWAQAKSAIVACSSNITIDCKMNANAGALVGSNVGSIKLSYSTGEIKKAADGNVGGGLIGQANNNSSYYKCFATTNVTNGHGFFSTKGTGTTTFSECFTTNTQNNAPSAGITASANIESIKTGLNEKTETVEGVTYKFEENTGSDKDQRPLIIVKGTAE